MLAGAAEKYLQWLGVVMLAILAVPPSSGGQNLVLNSGFESSVSYWMPLDGWMASTIYDCPFQSKKPDLFKDGLAGSKLPDPWSARVTEEKYEGRYSCRLDKEYETIHSAYVKLPLPGTYTCSAWMKSTYPDTEVRVTIVSAERSGDGWGEATGEFTQVFTVGTQWQRYWFQADLPATEDGRYQVIFHLPVRRGGDTTPATQRVDLRPRSNPEKLYIDAVQLEPGELTDYRPASDIEVGARFLDTEDWVFVEGEMPTLEIQSASRDVKEFRIRVGDWQDNTVWQKVVPVDSAAAAGGVQVPIELDAVGYFRAFVTAIDASGRASRQLELPFGIVHRHPVEGDFEDSPFGGMFTITRNYGSSWFKPGHHLSWYELDERQIRTARKIGMRWVKTEAFMGFTSWACVEPQRGVFQWGDPEVRLIKKYGFWIYGKLYYVPGWAQRPEERFHDFHVGPPGDLAGWDNYVRRSLEHYTGELAIRHWGVFIEPFSASFWRGTAAQHVDLTKRSYQIAKSIDPNIMIGGPCSQSPFYRFQTPGLIDGIIRGGELNYCDIYTYHRCHALGEGGQMPIMPEETELNWVEDINTFKRWMQEYGKGLMPIWNTEFRQWTTSGYLDESRFATVGYAKHSQKLAVDAKTSVEWVVRGQVVSMAHGVSKLFVFGMGPCGWNYDQSSWQYMKEADGRPKPWMLSYSAMAYLLEGTQPAGQVALGKRVRCYLFSKSDKTIAVIWGLFTDQQGQGQLKIAPAGSARLLDIMGNTAATATANPLTVPLTSTPYYIVFPETSSQQAAAALDQAQVIWSSAE